MSQAIPKSFLQYNKVLNQKKDDNDHKNEASNSDNEHKHLFDINLSFKTLKSRLLIYNIKQNGVNFCTFIFLIVSL